MVILSKETEASSINGYDQVLTFHREFNDHIMHESKPDLFSSTIIVFQFKETQMPGHILKFIDRLARSADYVYPEKARLIL
jgi:hypothetical protein